MATDTDKTIPMVNGFRVDVLIDDEPYKLVFASTRKCPKLLGCLKTIKDISRKLRMVDLRMDAAERAISADSSNSKALRAYEGIMEETDTLQAAYYQAVGDFYLTGLLGAGYTEDLAERYSTCFGPEEFLQMQALCLTGGGFADFTKRASNSPMPE